MPSLLIRVNESIPEETQHSLAKACSEMIARTVGKPESFVLVSVEKCVMTFGGTAAPAAYCVRRAKLVCRRDYKEQSEDEK